MMRHARVRVKVPATSANLGPGFDCLGLSLGLYLELEIREEEGEGFELRVGGEGADIVAHDERNAVYQAVLSAFAHAKRQPQRLYLNYRSDIPLASGLGSSSAALVAGLAAGAALCGRALDRDELVRWGVAVEGHPDNVAPCVLGGVVVAASDGDHIEYACIEPYEGLRAVVAVPDFPLPTEKARAILPREISRADAVFNLGRVGLLTAALGGGRGEWLRLAMQDRLHEPYRRELVPGLEEVRAAALDAGALGAALSGAGPSVLALVEEHGRAVAAAMQAAWGALGVQVRTWELELERQGLTVEGVYKGSEQ
jgi:homoserine kinase